MLLYNKLKNYFLWTSFSLSIVFFCFCFFIIFHGNKEVCGVKVFV